MSDKSENNVPDPSKLKLPDVRLSFPDLFEAKSIRGSEPKYSAHFIIDKKEGAELIKQIRKAIYMAAIAEWGEEKAKKICAGKKFEKCLHDGEEKEDMVGYGADVMYVSANSSRRPLVIDRDRTPLTKDDRRPYGGCYVNAIVRLWVQDNDFGQRVNAELMGVQFLRDGEPFGSYTPVGEDDFPDLDEGKGKDKDKDKDGKKAKGKPADEALFEPDDDEIPF